MYVCVCGVGGRALVESRIEVGDGRAFGSRHRFTGGEFYRRHFVALHFHAGNVACQLLDAPRPHNVI